MVRGRVDQFGGHTDNYGDANRYHQTAHEFEFGGHKYRCNPLAPLEQVHVARRLAPVILAALKPEDGRRAILARLMKLASLAEAQATDSEERPDQEQVISDAMDLATSILSAAAAADEEMVNAIIRKVMAKILRTNENGGGMFMWDSRPGYDQPVHRDVNGFTILSLTGRYLVYEFRDAIAEYIASLGIKPGPALMAAAGLGQRPPGAPGTI